jgi:hypothetical protein
MLRYTQARAGFPACVVPILSTSFGLDFPARLAGRGMDFAAEE